MERKILLGILLTMLFIGMLTLVFNIQPAKASGTIYIRADGSIEGTTHISTVDNITYTFTDDIYDSIVVERSNIIIDGDGYTLQAVFPLGFHLDSIGNVTIKRTNIKGFTGGICLFDSSYNKIFGNNITNNNIGIYLDHSSNNIISGNNIINNSESGIYAYDSSNNIIYHNNFVDNNLVGQVEILLSTNVWDDGYPSGGNYWSDQDHGYCADHFSGPGQDISDSDGIVDDPYVIDENNRDRYPLMEPFPCEITPRFTVGGTYIPANKLELLAPYIGLTILLVVAVISVSYVNRRKRHT